MNEGRAPAAQGLITGRTYRYFKYRNVACDNVAMKTGHEDSGFFHELLA